MSGWGTESEIEFIKKLGTKAFTKSKKTRKEILKNYLEAAKKRYNWGQINKIQVIDFVESEITYS